MYINSKIKCIQDYIKYDESDIEVYETLGTTYESKDKNI